MYATRHGLKPKQAVDATLIFGTPIVTMGFAGRPGARH